LEAAGAGYGEGGSGGSGGGAGTDSRSRSSRDAPGDRPRDWERAAAAWDRRGRLAQEESSRRGERDQPKVEGSVQEQEWKERRHCRSRAERGAGEEGEGSSEGGRGCGCVLKKSAAGGSRCGCEEARQPKNTSTQAEGGSAAGEAGGWRDAADACERRVEAWRGRCDGSREATADRRSSRKEAEPEEEEAEPEEEEAEEEEAAKGDRVFGSAERSSSREPAMLESSRASWAGVGGGSGGWELEG
jgi:hypothetical protein